MGFIFSEPRQGGTMQPGPDHEIVAAGFRAIYPPEGKDFPAFPVAAFEFTSPDAQDPENPIKQSFSGLGGTLEYLALSDDGETPAVDVKNPSDQYEDRMYPYCISIKGGDQRPGDGDEFWEFLKSIADCGFDLTKCDEAGTMEPLVGLKGEIIHKDLKYNYGQRKGQSRPVPVFASLDNPDGAGSKKAAKKASKKAAKKTTSDFEITEEDREKLYDAAIAAGGSFDNPKKAGMGVFAKGGVNKWDNGRDYMAAFTGMVQEHVDSGEEEIAVVAGESMYTVTVDGESVSIAKDDA